MDRVSKALQRIIIDYIDNLSRKIPIDKVIVFGFYTKGNAYEYSDLVLAIFSDYFKDINKVDGICFLMIEAMCYDLDLGSQPFTMDNYSNRRNSRRGTKYWN